MLSPLVWRLNSTTGPKHPFWGRGLSLFLGEKYRDFFLFGENKKFVFHLDNGVDT